MACWVAIYQRFIGSLNIQQHHSVQTQFEDCKTRLNNSSRHFTLQSFLIAPIHRRDAQLQHGGN